MHTDDKLSNMITRYLGRALDRATYRMLPDGTFSATVPGLRGVVATGDTLEGMRRDLLGVFSPTGDAARPRFSLDLLLVVCQYRFRCPTAPPCLRRELKA